MKQKVYRKKSPSQSIAATKAPVIQKIKDEPRAVLQSPIKQKGNQLAGIIVCSLTILVFLLLWIQPFHVKVEDPWTTAGLLVNQASSTQQPQEKQRLLKEAHVRFEDLVRQHPYHARLWYIYGFYFMQTQQWDSVVACNKKAIELGKGGTVNQVEFSAADNLCYGLSMQFNDPSFKQNGTAILKSAEVNGFANPCLLRLQGAYYTNRNSPDSALFYLRQAVSLEKTADTYYNIAVNNYNKQRRDSAMYYLKAALGVNKDYQPALQLLQQLSNSTK